MHLLASLLTLATLGAPTVDSLLLDLATRTSFTARWTPFMVKVVYRPPASPLEDQALTAPLEVAGFLLAEEPDAPPVVVTPARRLEGLKKVTVLFGTGTTTPATVLWPQDGRDVPLVRLRLDKPPPNTPGLQWAPEERLERGRRAWVIERPSGKGPNGKPLDVVLVDTSIGPKVEPPLERFLSARLREADGLPLLDVDGTVLCAVYRTSPVDPSVAYCTPGQWAFEVPTPEEP